MKGREGGGPKKVFEGVVAGGVIYYLFEIFQNDIQQN
jgi:hypothetical protein